MHRDDFRVVTGESDNESMRVDFRVITGESDDESMRVDFRGITSELDIEPMLSCNQLKVGESLQRQRPR